MVEVHDDEDFRLLPSRTILREKEAWNHAIFFGVVAAVTAWRLNSDAGEALPPATDAASAPPEKTSSALSA